MKRVISLLLAVVLVVGMLPVSVFAAEDYELKVLTFEGEYWDALIDSPQHGGPLLYGEETMGFYSEEEAYQWSDETTGLSHVLPYNYNVYCFFGGGHAVSHYASADYTTYGNFENQLTVYDADAGNNMATSGGGHNGSDNFAIHYGYMDGSIYNQTEELPALSFSDGEARVIDHMYVNMTTYALYALSNGNELTEAGGTFEMVAVGFNGETKTGEVKLVMADGENPVTTGWTKWDLSGLGAVTAVQFNVIGTADNGYGFSQPAYFAYDDVAVRFPKAGGSEPAEFEIPNATNIARITGVTGFEQGENGIVSLWGGMQFCEAIPVFTASVPANTSKIEITFKNGGHPVYENSAGNPVISGAVATYGVDETYTYEEYIYITGYGGGENEAVKGDDDLYTITLNVAELIEGEKYYVAYDSSNAPIYILGFVYAAGSGEPACTHSKKNTNYEPVERKEDEQEHHTVTVTCANADCGEQVEKTTGNCEDKDYDLMCDLCHGDVQCTHPISWQRTDYVRVENTETHTITIKCGICGAQIGEVTTGNCADENGDLKCNKCGGAIACKHTEDKQTTNYERIEGTEQHTITVTCSCGATIGEVTQGDCEDGNVDGQCDQCKGAVKVEQVDASGPWDGTTLVMPQQVGGIYQIGNGAELAWFAQKAAASDKAVLTADIDLNGKTWTPMASLSGSFDGQGHTVKNLSGSQGLFTKVAGASNTARAEVKNVTVEGTVSGKTNIAGIAGTAYYANFANVINRAKVTGSNSNVAGIVGYSLTGTNSYITLTNCGNEGDIYGTASVGGLIGFCKAYTVIESSYNTASISGNGSTPTGGLTGGLAGYMQNNSTVTNCYNTGAVDGRGNYAGGLFGNMYNGVTATNCYNTGTVTGGSGKVGAIAARAYNKSTSKATNCYYLDTSCDAVATNNNTAVVAGSTAKTDAEMKGVAFIDELGEAYKKGEVYPALIWETVEIQTSAYKVTPPETEGITFQGGETATDTELYKFSVAIKDFYEVTDTFAVKIGGEKQTEVSCENHVYSFEYTASGDFAITVEGVQYTGVTLDKKEAELYPGDAVTLTAAVDPASGGTVTWATDNEAVATVNNGVVTARKAGQATITASVGGEASAMFRVTVLHAPTVVHDKSVSGMNRMAYIDSLTIHDVTVKEFIWKGDTCVVTLDADTPGDAVIRFVKTGSNSLTINGDDFKTYQHALEGGYLKADLVSSDSHYHNETKYMIFQVEGVDKYVPVKRVEFIDPPETLMRGHSVTLRAKVYPENATIQGVKFSMQNSSQQSFGLNGSTLSVTNDQYFLTTQTVVVTSLDDASVTATTDVEAVVHSITEETAASCSYSRIAGTQTHSIAMICSCGDTGSNTAACADGNGDRKCDKCGGEVELTVEDVTLDKTSATIQKGESVKLTATVTPDSASGETVTWISSDEDIATVKDGTVTGLAKGTVTITASCGGKTATCEVTVQVPITRIRWWNQPKNIEITEITMTEGDELVDIVVGCSPKGTSENVLTFDVEDPQVVTVSPSEGKADDVSSSLAVRFNALKTGTTTVTATAKGTKVSKSLAVTVLSCEHADADGSGSCDRCGNPIAAKVGSKLYTSISAAIAEAMDGAEVQLMPGTFDEIIAPQAGDSQHKKEKSITITGSTQADKPTVLTGGITWGYDDGHTRSNSVTISNITFKNKGIYVADEATVVIENNRFENITGIAIVVLDQEYDGIQGSVKVLNNTVVGAAEGATEMGIRLRNPYNAEVTGNTVSNTGHNALLVEKNANNAENAGTVTITGNTLSGWGTSGEGRALRADFGAGTVANKTITVTGNKLLHSAAPEEFVKITNIAGEKAVLNDNYWGGKNPAEQGILIAEGAELVTYYADAAMETKACTGDCVDADGNGQCDKCEAALIVAAKVGDKTYATISEAIADAPDGATVQIMPGTFDEAIRPQAGDSQHKKEKSIIITGSNDKKNPTVLTGGIVWGYDDGHTRNHSVTIKNITFQNIGVYVHDEANVVIENNKFQNIDVKQNGIIGAAIYVSDQEFDGVRGSVTVRDNIVQNAVTGIRLRNAYTVTITGNEINNTKDNAILLEKNHGTDNPGDVTITGNILKNWGTGGEGGRALRAAFAANHSANKKITVTGNKLDHSNAPEEFVKITDIAGDTVVLNDNYWGGNNPTAKGILIADGAEVVTYYADAAMSSKVCTGDCVDADRNGQCDYCGGAVQTGPAKGDVDGDGEITALDATCVLQSVVGLTEFTDESIADMDGDNEITALDATWILQMVVGLNDDVSMN